MLACSALAIRDLMKDLRQDGTVTEGPAPMTPKDRSRFLSRLHETVGVTVGPLGCQLKKASPATS